MRTLRSCFVGGSGFDYLFKLAISGCVNEIYVGILLSIATGCLRDVVICSVGGRYVKLPINAGRRTKTAGRAVLPRYPLKYGQNPLSTSSRQKASETRPVKLKAPRLRQHAPTSGIFNGALKCVGISFLSHEIHHCSLVPFLAPKYYHVASQPPFQLRAKGCLISDFL